MIRNDKYEWTMHVRRKMQHYGISESRVKRIIRFPKRTEEGIVPNTIAVMQPASVKTTAGKPAWNREIWVMYKLAKRRVNPKHEIRNQKQKALKIITAWRYPGKSPERDPIPKEVLTEIQSLL